MNAKLTILVLFFFTLSCKDDLRIKVVGGSLGIASEFQINSPANLVTRDSYPLEWTSNPLAKTYSVVIAHDKECSDVVVKKEGLTESKLNLDFLADNAYFICVFAEVKGQKVPAANNGLALTVDTAPPLVTAPTDVRTKSEAFDPELDIKDLSQVWIKWSQLSGDGIVTFEGQNMLKPRIKADVDGLYKIKATLTDAAGNVAEEIFQFYWDQIGPAVSLGDPITTSAAAAFALSVDSTAKTYEWTYAGGPANGILSFSDSSAKIPLITADVEGTYQVTLKATDSSGNVGTDSASFTWDVTPPTFVSLGFAGPAGDGFLNAQDRLLSTSILGSLDANGYAEVKYKLVSASTTCNASLSYANLPPVANTSAIAADGPYKVCVLLRDEAGNSSYGASANVQVDTVPATFVSISLTGDVLDGILSLSEHALSNDLVTSLIANDATISEYALVVDGTACSGPLAYSTSVPKNNDARFVASADYRVCVRVRDQALNAFEYGQSSIISFTAAAPTLFSLAKTGAASDGYINDSEKAGAVALWTLNQSGAALWSYTAPLNDTASAVVCDASQSYTRPNPATAAELLSDVPWAICVKLRDSAGNVTYGKSDTVTRDVVAPAFGSLSGSGLASDGIITADEMSTTGAAWVLTASGHSSVTYSALLDDSASAVVCNASATYSQSTLPTLAGITPDGTWAICAKLSDEAGNVDYGKSSAIVRDAQPPVFTSLLGANEASDGTIRNPEASSNLPLFTLVASGAATIDYTLALDDATPITCDAVKTYGQTSIPLISSLGSDSSYAVCVKLSDTAGNTVYGKSQTIVKNSSAPTFTSLVRAAEASDGAVNDSEKSALNALWTLSESGSITTSYSVPLDDTAGAVVCNAAKTYSQSIIARAADLPSDGPWVICVKLDDGAGLVTYGKSQQVVRDIQAPAFTSLASSNAASDGYINDSEKLLVSALYSLTAGAYTSAAYTLPLAAAAVCDVSQTYSESSIPQASSISADGSYAVCVRLSDAAGNTSYGKSDTVIRDIVAPTFTSLNSANAASDGFIKGGEENSNLAIYALTASGHSASVYTLALDDSTPITCNAAQTYGQSAIPLISSISSDGTYAVCTRLSDAAGNTSYGKSQSVVRDVLAPTFTSLLGSNEASDAFINNSEKTATNAAWGLLASGQTISAYTLALDDTGGAVVCNAAQTYNQSAIPTVSSLASDGPWAICVRLSDAAGNATYGKSEQITRDTSGPTFTSLIGANEASDGWINDAEKAAASALLTLSGSGYVTAAYTLALDDTPAVSCDNSQTYGQASVPTVADLASDESWAVCVRLTDASGNTSYGKSQVIVRDTVAPVFTSLTRAAEGSDGYINDSEKSATTALWTLSSSGSGTIAYSSPLDDTAGTLACNGGKTYGQGTTVAGASDLSSDGFWSLCVKLSDAAGNITYGKGQQIVRDILAPTFTSLARANAASDGYINDSEKALTTALWTLTASGHAVAAYTLALDDTAAAQVCDSGDTYGQSSIALPTGLAADGAYALCVRLTDAAGNIAYGKSAQVVRDIVAPTFTSLNGANEASDLIINNGEQNSVLALFALTASGHASSTYTVGLDDTAGALTCNAAQTYSQGAIPTVISLGLDGTYAVCVRLADAAGNASFGKSQQLVRNVGGPSFTSLAAAGGASDTYINDSEKASTAAAWTLTAAAYTAATYTLPLNDTAGAVVCDASQTYGQGAIAQIDEIPSDGPWAICVKLVDGVANVTYGKSQQIIRDILAPTFTSLGGANEASDTYINAGEASSSAALAALTASGYDSVLYTVALDDTAAAVTCDGAQTYDQAGIALISSLSADKPYALCVKLSDASGNISFGKSQQITRDVTPPVFTSLVKAAEGADAYINDSEKAATNPLWTLTASGASATAYTTVLDDTAAALACNSGKTYNQGTTVATAASMASDGAWSICVQLSDAAGNITYGKGEQITRDIALPVFTSLALAGAASDGFVNDSEKLLVSALWTLSASGQSATDYTLALDDTAAAVVCDNTQSYAQSSIATPASLAADQPYALCVRLTDTAGNITYGKSAQIIRDIAAPVFTSLNGANGASDLYIKSGEEASSAALYALTASGHSSDDFTVALSDDPSAVVCNGSRTYNQASSPLINSLTVDGKYAVCVKLMDAAGNITYGKSQQIERDIVAPAFTSLLGANGASDGYIKDSEKASTAAAWALIASGQSATAYTLPLDDTTPVTCDGSQTYGQAAIAQIDGVTSDSAWAICVRLTDAAGNLSYGKSQQIIRDIIAPTFTSLNGANGASDLYISSTESASTSALFTLVSSGSSAIAYTLALDDTPSITCDNTQTYGQASIAQINSLGSDESYALCVRLSDAAGNITYGKSQTVVKDTTAPTFTSLAKSAEGSDGYISDSEKAQTTDLWTLTSSGQSSIAYTLALSDTAGAQICDGSDSYNQGTAIPGASDLASDGAWTLCVRLTDAAGNITYGKGDQITRDIVYPIFTSLSVLNAASDGYINDSEKLLTNAMWSLSASGQTVTDYTAALSDTAGAQVCDSGDSYNQGTTVAIPSSLSSDGAYALCVRLTDAAGNITYGKSAQITRDIVYPVFGSLAGANEASDGYIKSGEESAANPIYAIAGSSGYTVDDFTAALDDSAAITCNSGKTYGNGSIPLINTVTPDGTYAVCARLADAAGNNTYGKSSQVIRDIVAPVFTSLSAASVAADGYIAYGERNSATAAWTLSASGQTSTSYTVALDDTSSAVVCDAAKTYGSGSIPLVSSIVTDGAWAACVRLVDVAGNITYGKSQQIVRDIVAPGTPTGFAATAGNRFIDLKWTASTGSPAGYVLVRGPAGSAPTFVPSDGTTYSLGAQGSDQIIAIGAGTLALDNALTLAATYSYKVYAYDLALSYSAAASTSGIPVTPCASNYVFVAGDPDYGTQDFCVMKYEAKSSSGVATSQASSVPWTSISHLDAITACSTLGSAYSLIDNDQWMTAGSNIAAFGSNWTGGSVGSGQLFTGHSDNNPTGNCAASTNDGQYFVETNCTTVSSGDTAEQRRTFTLSNGLVIWDLSGNVHDSVNYINLNDKPGATNAYYEYSALTSTPSLRMRMLVPTHAVKSFWDDSWNSAQGTGRLYPATNGYASPTGGAARRGGDSSSGTDLGGLFQLTLNATTTDTGTNAGFRCVQNLPDLDPSTLSLVPSDGSITASWTTVGGASGYILVRGAAGSLPSFQPVNGTSYSAGSQSADTIVYAGASLSAADTSLENGLEYHYALYSWSGSNVYAAPARAKDTPTACPTGFVLVPGDTDYGTDDFCMMKYEAKSVGGVATSIAKATPWYNIRMTDAVTACSAMGPGYHLLSNPEFMTAANNIFAKASNWSSGTVGTGAVARGHSDSNPSYACPASDDVSKAWVENTCAPLASGQGENSEATQRRTLTLSNGNVVWDLAGNVYEMVNAYNYSDRPMNANAGYEYTAVTGTVTTPLKYLIPTNAIKSYWVNSWNASKGVGTYWGGPNNTWGGVYSRGGPSYGDGLFGTTIDFDPTGADVDHGFRCSLRGLKSNTPKNFAATLSGNAIALSWATGGSTTAGYLLVRGQVGKLPVFQPANGTTYTSGAQGNDTILYVGVGTGKIDTGLTTAGAYSYRLYGYDAARTYSSAALQSMSFTRCPENWVFVPGDPAYRTSDFCVMKYEAKNDGASVPISVASGTPYASLSSAQSNLRCSTTGMGVHLITNEEWMTVTSNIAGQNSNWTGASVGSGTLFQGHNDSSPNAACQASTDDSYFYVETNCTPKNSGDSSDQRRTHTLSNGQVIWDLSGNIWDLTHYHNKSGKAGATSAWYEYNVLSGSSLQPLRYLVPTNAVKSYWSNSWSSTKGIGAYYPFANGSYGDMIRGGDFAIGSGGGAFMAYNIDENDTLSNVGFRCVQLLPDADSTTLTLSPGTTSITASWASTGASSYLLLRGPGGSEPTFTPLNGTSYGTGAQGSDTIVYAGSGLTHPDTGLSAGTRYYYALYAVDASNNYTPLTRDSEVPVSCPSNYVLVPGDADYLTEDFCIMKYEARDVSSVPTSQASSNPWSNVSLLAAKQACAGLGEGYAITTNAEWMAMSANAAGQNSNWTGGTVGSGSLFKGHTDNSPTTACPASTNDSLYFVETDCTAIGSGDTAEQRRTHTLSNGSVLWDISGNVWDKTDYVNTSDKPTPATLAFVEYTALTGSTTAPLRVFIPTHAVKSYWNDSWTAAANGIGSSYLQTNGNGGAFKRGGYYNSTSSSGMFAAALQETQGDWNVNTGFRCVKH